MRNILKAATLESKFPILSVEEGCILSKDADVTIGQDSVVYPGCTLQGNTRIGEDCLLLPKGEKIAKILRVR